MKKKKKISMKIYENLNMQQNTEWTNKQKQETWGKGYGGNST